MGATNVHVSPDVRIDLDELVDITIDVGALGDYLERLDYPWDSPLVQRIFRVNSRLLILLGLYRHDDDGYLVPVDDHVQSGLVDAETVRGREWLEEDLVERLAELERLAPTRFPRPSRESRGG